MDKRVQVMGFEEVPHTADYAMRVWAEDLVALCGEAARGLNFLAGVEIDAAVPLRRPISLRGDDQESLLVAFLSELVFLQEQEHEAFEEFSLTASEDELAGLMIGGRIRVISKPIKAATFHGMQIRRTARGLEAVIVLDV